MRRTILCLLLACLSSPVLAALSYRVDIDAPDALKPLLADNLELVTLAADPEMDEGTLAALVEEAPAAARRLLETAGYFGAGVTVRRDGDTVRVDVRPGEPVRITRWQVHYRGAIANDAAALAALRGELAEQWPLADGAVFTQDGWDDAKKLALQLVAVGAYPLAKIASAEAKIDPATHGAALTITIDSGEHVDFGRIRVEGLKRYPEKVVTGQADFQRGSAYSLEKLTAFQSALEADPHFSSAIVVPLKNEVAEGRMPILVRVVELPRQKAELGLKWDSEQGPGTRIGYEHYNIFRRGYVGSILLDWNRDESSLNFGLALPRTRDGYSHTANVALKKSEVQGVERDSVEGGVWRLRQRGDIEARIGVEYVLDRETVGGVEDKRNQAVFATVGWTQRKLDDVLDPRNGYLLDGRLSSTLGSALSDTAFVRGRARAALYWSPSFFPGTWLMRGDVGEVWAQQTASVPSSLLFRAGGAGSVRGYEYESLGVAGPNGAIEGGRVLATGSLQYMFTVRPGWRLALFHDLGDAADSWDSYRARKSYGFGVEWLSPVAPISFDIARGESEQKWRWTMSLGLPF
ncbi:autotransporter assembly complex protein TamA [Crenobacter intestini]|uniref:Outer membrane protein assembly factor n=1 Tax=Crenobacter intestini TaxID=2563443 RepID=A0A4T0UQR2_9NEIS|nr:autotransporter assembly complex family protein [Crenobacter intestini]TIC81189.1 outer membrane protein assembly factor [Crenobacter intestini]